MRNKNKKRLTHRKSNNVYMRKVGSAKRIYCAAIKQERGCRICGIKEHYVLDFHHPLEIGKNKRPVWDRLPWDDLIIELDKCEILCANCHRRDHYLKRKGR